MTASPLVQARSNHAGGPVLTAIILVITLAAFGGVAYLGYRSLTSASLSANFGRLATVSDDERDPTPAPELDGGVEWLNCGGPIRMKDLRGKIVLLDFWTYCCINCIHVLPDLAELEKKYADQLVVIGVHWAKFDAEKKSENIRDAILRYDIEHPVVNDANHMIRAAYRVQSWPTFWLIDPEGNLYGRGSGEGLLEPLERAIDHLIEMHREKKTLNEEPLRFDLAKFRARKTAPIFFPGKLLADLDNNRLFIADSSHHRFVVTDLDGKKLDIIGTGEAGKDDGSYDKAAFNDPQGMALRGDTLYVADRKNHLIRAVDLKNRIVKTIAGVGEQSHDRFAKGDALKTGLNSPWDLWLHGDHLYIAMAGHHQIWRMNLSTNTIGNFAGTGRESIADGSYAASMFSQPSGLSSDGDWLFVADSEISAVRAISLKQDEVKTLVGEGLFEFGDIDGVGDAARLQHCLGVAFYKGKVYVADTYNNKIKTIDPMTRECKTFLGDGTPGNTDDPPRFDEPAGIHIAGDKLYVADTNNHSIRVVDLKTKKVSTIALSGVEPPQPAKKTSRPAFPNATNTKVQRATISADGEVEFKVTLNLPADFKLNPLAPMDYVIESAAAGVYEQVGKVEKPASSFGIKVPAAKLAEAETLKVSLVYYPCREGGEGVCQIKSQIWEVPIKLDPDSDSRTIHLETVGVP